MTAAETPDPSATIVTPVQVMFFDTDAGGVVHNIAYLRFIETARTLLAVGLGMDWERMARTSVYPVVVRTEIDYRRPAILGDSLEVHGRLGEATPVRFWCHFEILRPRDGALLITCRQLPPSGRPDHQSLSCTRCFRHAFRVPRRELLSGCHH